MESRWRRPLREAGQRVPNDRVLFDGEELRGAYQRLDGFVDPQAGRRQDG